jgi:undecaprenyl-diphosphatase
MGNWQMITVFVAFFTYYFWKNHNTLFFLLLAVGGSTLLANIIKIIVKKPRRPDALLQERTYAFPSGHAATSTAFYGFLALHVLKGPIHTNSIIQIAILASLIIAISYSRIYLRVHDWADVKVGFIIGLLFLLPYATA